MPGLTLNVCRPKFAPTSDRAYWTEIRPYKHYMVIGSELEGNGVQIFDMKKVSCPRASLSARS